LERRWREEESRPIRERFELEGNEKRKSKKEKKD